MKTFDIDQAAIFLGAHKETVRRLTSSGQLPGVKIGKKWIFIEQDLVDYMRSQYACGVTSQGAMSRREKQWRFTKETPCGGLVSPTMDREYSAALGLATK